MKAVFKNKLIIKFDRAINDAADSNCEIICFKLESEEENRVLEKYIELSGCYVDPERGLSDFDYEGIVIHPFVE